MVLNIIANGIEDGKTIQDIVKATIHDSFISPEEGKKWMNSLIQELNEHKIQDVNDEVKSDQLEKLEILLTTAAMTIRYFIDQNICIEYGPRFWSIFLQILNHPLSSNFTYLRVKMTALSGCIRCIEVFDILCFQKELNCTIHWITTFFSCLNTMDDKDNKVFDSLFPMVVDFLNILSQVMTKDNLQLQQQILFQLLALHKELDTYKPTTKLMIEFLNMLGLFMQNLLPIRSSVDRLLSCPIHLCNDDDDSDDEDLITHESIDPTLILKDITMEYQDSLEQSYQLLHKHLDQEKEMDHAFQRIIFQLLPMYPFFHSNLSISNVLLQRLNKMKLNTIEELEFLQVIIESMTDDLHYQWISKNIIMTSKDFIYMFQSLNKIIPQLKKQLSLMNKKESIYRQFKSNCSQLRHILIECFKMILYIINDSIFQEIENDFFSQTIPHVGDPMLLAYVAHIFNKSGVKYNNTQKMETFFNQSFDQMHRYPKETICCILKAIGLVIMYQHESSFAFPFFQRIYSICLEPNSCMDKKVVLQAIETLTIILHSMLTHKKIDSISEDNIQQFLMYLMDNTINQSYEEKTFISIQALQCLFQLKSFFELMNQHQFFSHLFNSLHTCISMDPKSELSLIQKNLCDQLSSKLSL